MSTNTSADKGAVVRQRQPEKGDLPHVGTAANDSDKLKKGNGGRAEEQKSDAKRKTRRGGKKRFKKNRANANKHDSPRNDNQHGHVLSERMPETAARKKHDHDEKNQHANAEAGAASHKSGKENKTVDKRTAKPAKRHQGGVYSAIDLGTNNCRLLIAKPTRHGFRVIDAFSRIVRLGEGVGKDNRLSDEAMDRTIDALKVCSEKLARRGVTCMRHVATEACRIADNSEEFVARVKRETGINLDVISAGEEARLAVLGCQSLIAADKRNALVFDIGGGSTELIWVKVRPGRQTEIKGWVSVPWGVVNLTETFTKKNKPLKNKKYKEMVKIVEGHLQEFNNAHQLDKILKGRHTQFLGTSGTVTTLASLHLELPRYIRDKVDGAWMKAKDIKALSRRVAEMTPEERAAEPCIGSERADLVVAGCAILEAILGMWQVPSLRVADRGIREGILRGLMQLDPPPISSVAEKKPSRHKRNRRKKNKGIGEKGAVQMSEKSHG